MREEEFEHHAEVLTAGQVRALLAEYPDDMPVHVSTLADPGGDVEDYRQVVTSVERGIGRYGTAREWEDRPDPYVTLMCDWPSGTYVRTVLEDRDAPRAR